jgi:hypothetical protein
MNNRTTAEQPTAERNEKPITGRATLWVVLAVSLSVPLGGAVAGTVLSAGFSVLDPWFLFFSLVSFASALLGAAGTALVTAR